MADLLANLIAALHLAYFAFIVGGTIAIIVGARQNWAWIRNWFFRLLHVVAVYVVLVEEVFDIPCPLNVAQWTLREVAGGPQEATAGMAGVLDSLLFRTIPGGVLDVMYWSLGVALLVLLYVVPPRRLKCHSRERVATERT